MPYIARTLFALAALSAAFPAPAQAPAVQPGEYLTERGWGTLSIRRDAGAKLLFTLEAVGGNFHLCSLEGEVRNGRATLEGSDGGKPCIVSFTPREGGLDVKDVNGGACRDYHCGARAHFEGLYFRPPPACATQARRKTRDGFKRLYDRKAYAEARAALEPVLAECGKVLNWIEEGWVRNDLAITLHRLGDHAGCQRVLQPLAEDAAKTDAVVRDERPPSDADAYLPVVKAARANLRLCRAGAGKG